MTPLCHVRSILWLTLISNHLTVTHTPSNHRNQKLCALQSIGAEAIRILLTRHNVAHSDLMVIWCTLFRWCATVTATHFSPASVSLTGRCLFFSTSVATLLLQRLLNDSYANDNCKISRLRHWIKWRAKLCLNLNLSSQSVPVRYISETQLNLITHYYLRYYCYYIDKY